MSTGVIEVSSLIERGGPLMWVILGLGFIGLVWVIERMFFFHSTRINVGAALMGLTKHVQRRAFAEAVHEAARVPGPVGRVAHAGLKRYYLERRDLVDVVKEAAQLEVPRIEKNIRAIQAVALMAPMVGLLGTMLGIAETLMRMGEDGYVSSGKLPEGVLAAVLTSVMGMAVAVPLYIFYLYFLGKARRLVARLERVAIEVVHMIADAREEDLYAPFRSEVQTKRKAQLPP